VGRGGRLYSITIVKKPVALKHEQEVKAQPTGMKEQAKKEKLGIKEECRSKKNPIGGVGDR